MSNPLNHSMTEAQHASHGQESSSAPQETERLQLLQEVLQVAKRDVVTGTVRVSTRTETYEEMAEVSLDRDIVDVTRVPIGKLVEVAPAVRTENGTTIVPVIEEHFVIVKQLFLKEELHIRHHVERELLRTPVPLRRQVATVERIDHEDHTSSTRIEREQISKRADEAPDQESLDGPS